LSVPNSCYICVTAYDTGAQESQKLVPTAC